MLPDDSLISLRDIHYYADGRCILDNLSLTIKEKEILGVIGRSGAGKSSLVQAINGLLRVTHGQIEIKGCRVEQFTERDWRKLRKKISIIFQGFNLLSSRTVLDNVALPLKLDAVSTSVRRARAMDMLSLVGLDSKAYDYPYQLSGGQKQRVAIARALVSDPWLLLSDESTSALDPETTASILELLRELHKKLGLTILLITHEMEVIHKLAQRVIVLDQGKIIEEGTVFDIFAHPKHKTTKSLLQSFIPSLPSEIAGQLQSYGSKAVVFVKIIGTFARTGFLHSLSVEFGLFATILHGTIDNIAGEPIGYLFLAVQADKRQEFERGISWLQQKAEQCEVLGYVS